jgi:acyl carrier protein
MDDVRLTANKILRDIASHAGDLAAIHKEVSQIQDLGAGPALVKNPNEMELEDQIEAIWASMLGLEEIDREMDFFELGGDSILAVQVLSRMCSQLGITFSLVELMEGKLTIRALAEKIHAQGLTND